MSPEQLEEAIELDRKGHTYHAIAAKLGVPRITVARRLGRYHKRTLNRLERRGAVERGRQFDRLDWIVEELAKGWERSKQDAETIETTDDGAGGTRTKTVVKGQAGEPAFLDKAMKAMAEQRKILGIDQPEAAASNTVQVEFVNNWRDHGSPASPEDPPAVPPPGPAADPA